LEPKLAAKGEYEGIWAGYDSHNRSVNSGNYQWRQLLKTSIRKIPNEAQAKDRALSILSVSLGKRYIDGPTFQGYLEGKNTRFALGAFLNGEVIGVALGKVLEQEDAKYYESQAKKAGIRTALTSYQRVGHLKSVAVHERDQGRGVGTSLCAEAIRHLREVGCTAVFTVGWESGQTHSGIRVFKTLGFEILGAIEEFWQVDDAKDDHQCPKCGFPCKCTAVFCLSKL
jgi:ribosomal protein S18 acetylase RimI-like enzyme